MIRSPNRRGLSPTDSEGAGRANNPPGDTMSKPFALATSDPAFDPRTYGHRQLLSLIQAYPNMFEVRKSRPAKGGASAIYVRLKGRATPPAKSGTAGD